MYSEITFNCLSHVSLGSFQPRCSWSKVRQKNRQNMYSPTWWKKKQKCCEERIISHNYIATQSNWFHIKFTFSFGLEHFSPTHLVRSELQFSLSETDFKPPTVHFMIFMSIRGAIDIERDSSDSLCELCAWRTERQERRKIFVQCDGNEA